jgi:Mg/Co/Ni transporter MgtE
MDSQTQTTPNPPASGSNQTGQAQETSPKDVLNKDILELMGAEGMPEEKKKELYQKMMDTVWKRVIMRVDELLEDKDVDEWAQIVKSKDKTKMQQFFDSRGIDLAKIMVEETLRYKQELVELSKSFKR